MKINIYSAALLILVTLLSFSCQNDGDVTIKLDTVEDGMHIAVNAEEIILSQELMDEIALQLTWGEAQQRANNGEITYYLKLGLPGFTTAIDKIEIEEGVFEYSFNHLDLNLLLYSQLNIPYGSTMELEAEVIAWSEGDFYVVPEISTIKFTVTTFQIAPVNLYLVGSANPNGADIEHGIKLTEVVEGRDIGNKYIWEGELQAGTFKFVNSLTDDEGSWSMGTGETELVENTTVSGGEFTVEKAGWYSIALNKSEKEIIHGYKGFKQVWGVGLGIGIAWDMPSTSAFSWSERNPNIFTLECTTQANQDFKLPYNDQNSGWDSPFLRPYTENANIWSDNRVQATPGGYNPDLKWLITADQAGDCILTIDAYNETITLVKK